jgi:SAM-dependent methyltransferase
MGWQTTAFDVSESAVRLTRQRFPETPVNYEVADLLDPPSEWRRSFDLVVESLTVQSMPRSLRRRATSSVSSLVAPGGTLIVVAGAEPESGTSSEGPPWPLTREEVDAFAVDGLDLVTVELVPDEQDPAVRRWRAAFRSRETPSQA